MLCGNFKKRIDRQGRVGIPKKLRDGFSKEAVVVAGCGDHIEIWTQERWASEQLRSQKVLDKVLN